jgi:uncharacterized protein YndB with AHSA1/START domain
MTPTNAESDLPIIDEQFDLAGEDVRRRSQIRICVQGEYCQTQHEVRIHAAPATVLAYLTNAERMMTWLSRDVIAEPRRGGQFRLTDFDGLWIEGAYLDIVETDTVVLSWGGIEGLKPGQSTIEITIRPTVTGTLVKLRHFGLSESTLKLHSRIWQSWGLPKLKIVSEGGDPAPTCLRELADWREQHPYSTAIRRPAVDW